MIENKYKALVLDSNAFINHASIIGAAEVCEVTGIKFQEYYTIEQVFSEVRDKNARKALDQFPFEIKVRSPSKEAIDISRLEYANFISSIKVCESNR